MMRPPAFPIEPGAVPGNRAGASRCWALGLAAISFTALAQEPEIRCPEFPTPPAGRLEWVAPNLRYSGVPMQIKELVTDQSPQQVIAFYKSAWGGQPPYYHEYDVAGWKAIATLRARCFYTVQVKAEGRGARALLGVSARRDSAQPPRQGSDFPALSGSRVLNDIEHYDYGKTGRTLLIANDFSPETNAAFYRRALKADGWVAIVDRPVPGPRGVSHVLVLKHGHHEASMTIAPGAPRGSSIVVNQVDRP
jgi:hypothetical protein